MAVNLSDHFAQRREQHGRRQELQRLGVDDAAVRTPRVLTLTEVSRRATAALELADVASDAARVALSSGRGARPSAAAVMSAGAEAFTERVLSKQNAGLSPGDAYDAARKEDPEGYEAHNRSTTRAKDGSLLLARTATAVAKIEPVKKVSTGGSTVSAAWDIIKAKVAEIMEATACSEDEALNRALAENPSLYDAYIDEFKRRTGSEFPAERW